MSIAEFVAYLKKNKKSSELGTLYKKPVSETGGQMPSSQVYHPNIYHQADLLYMPEDEKFKYILTCIDLYDGACDAEPLKDRDNKTVLDGFTKIYKRKYLKYPMIITLDQGAEFKANTEAYFQKHKTYVKYALTGRHRQLANVERLNQRIQSVLFKRMTAQELLTGETSKEWVADLAPLIELFNKLKKKPLKPDLQALPIADEYTGKLYKIGQKVRIQLDYPINTTNQARLHGNFRTSDIRWSPTVHKVKEVLLKPNSPPMYLIDNDDNIARTKNQLQPVAKNVKYPDKKFIRGETEYHIIHKILDKQIVNRKTQYLVQWRGFGEDEATWINANELNRTKDLKEMKREFNLENE